MSTKRRVYLAGEGPHDIGDLARSAPYRAGREGFLQPVLRRLVGDAMGLEFEGQSVTTLPRNRLDRPADALARKAGQALAGACEDGCCAVVMAVDVDKEAGRRASPRERARRIRNLRNRLERGFEKARKKDPDLAGIPAIVATPCRMLEAWALADADVLARLHGPHVRAALAKLGCPEDLWGARTDPGSNHPKSVLRRLTGGKADMAAIAEKADLSKLATACPESFAPFA